ncbi:MAG: hypothetical protein KIH62_002375 [Candidatus Kerfeldbacteria bacterium]|nr:hypothetical protein [Candidatus Kerfeldbacteria bacterium]
MSALLALQHVLLTLIVQIVLLPAWWYTGGARKIMVLAVNEIEGIFRNFHIKTLAHYITAPMFGFRDPVSRVISICVRSVHFVLMLLSSCVLSVFWILVLFLWLIFPPVLAYQVWFHFFSVNS